eukprot:7947143-Alexandrium_andersonii.AAC.1
MAPVIRPPRTSCSRSDGSFLTTFALVLIRSRGRALGSLSRALRMLFCRAMLREHSMHSSAPV